VQFLQLLLSGVAQGCIYGLVALSLALVYKTVNTASASQGVLTVLGAVGILVAMAVLGNPDWLAALGPDDIRQLSSGMVDTGTPPHALAHGVVIGATGLLCGLLLALFRFSTLGMALQAASQNRLAAHYVGIPIQRLNGVAWCVAVLVAGVAGLLLAPLTFVSVNLGWIGLKALPAAAVGSLVGLPGAMGSGVAIGLLESFWGLYWASGVAMGGT
jgi:branched-chain amino acid transport system permease protein